jgi:hypothetical protein
VWGTHDPYLRPDDAAPWIDKIPIAKLHEVTAGADRRPNLAVVPAAESVSPKAPHAARTVTQSGADRRVGLALLDVPLVEELLKRRRVAVVHRAAV